MQGHIAASDWKNIFMGDADPAFLIEIPLWRAIIFIFDFIVMRLTGILSIEISRPEPGYSFTNL